MESVNYEIYDNSFEKIYAEISKDFIGAAFKASIFFERDCDFTEQVEEDLELSVESTDLKNGDKMKKKKVCTILV